jgi:hypothetical protein
VQRDERQLSRTRVCVDRAGAYDSMSEGFFACLSPHAPARPESQSSLGKVGPTRFTHVDHLGWSAPSSVGSGPRIVEMAT